MNNSDNEVIQKNTDFGSVLEVARKLHSYSIEDISVQLKIPAATITAIETNDLSALPPPTFTQGYIRTYARFLEISEDNVLNIYNQAVPHDLAADLKPRSTLPEEASSQSPLMKIVTLLLIAAGITAVVYGSIQYYQKKAGVMETELESKERSFSGNSLDSPGENRIEIRQNARLTETDELIVRQPDPVDKAETTEIPEQTERLAEHQAEQAEVTDVNETVTEELTTSKAVAVPAVEVKTIQKPAPAPVAEKAVSDNSQQVAATDELKIYAAQGSWMQVRDARKKRLLYSMIPRRGSKVLRGLAPFRISLGNAKTTNIVINGLAIDMSEYIRDNNTASFVVSTENQQVIFH